MNILLFGATGMIGQGVLRECLLDPDVQLVEIVGRSTSGVQHAKLREIVHKDLWNYAAIESSLAGFDACFFCLGVTSVGMEEKEYERITYGIATAAAETLCRLNPGMTFVFISGAGSDSTEKGKLMWARIKGKTENALLRMPFKGVYVFRIGVAVPVHGERSRTGWYNMFYTFTRPFLPLLQFLFPSFITTTEEIGRAMLIIAKRGTSKHILENRDVRAVARE